MPTLRELAENGQSVWVDTLSRSMIETGELQSLIDLGVRGVTANPTILDNAISNSADYDADIRRMAIAGKEVREVYESLALADIRRAADLLRPVYEATDGGDGYVSLEVDPHLADDTAATITEARHLFTALQRPNVMIKVPATPQGIPAIEQLISEGINVNITLMFSLVQYQAVAQAYISGLERILRDDGHVEKVASVASLFVSRIDTLVDKRLQEMGNSDLQGHIAIASMKLLYARFRGIFTSARWRALQERGARIQRPLWASTSTKDPRYRDTMYVDNLIGPHTVNTMPVQTLLAFLDHGAIAPMIELGLDEAQFRLARLSELGIDITDIALQLEEEGVQAFAASFDHLFAALHEKLQRFREEERHRAA